MTFNASLSTGRFPRQFKLANVFPLFKGGSLDPGQAASYRLISRLPIISRLLEKLVKAQLMSYIMENDLLPASQFAYRRRHSLEDALVLAVNR